MDKKEFNMRKELIELDHQLKMKSFKYNRETEEKKFDWQMQLQRIKSSEIRKHQMRKMEGGYKY